MLSISDCTLRDSRNTPGIYFSIDESIQIAKTLDTLGVDEIEAGFLSENNRDGELLKSLTALDLKASISSVFLCYSTNKIEKSLDCATRNNIKNILVSIPVSDLFINAKLKRSRRATIVLLQKVIKAAVKRDIKVSFSGEDAARSDVNWLVDYVFSSRYS